MIVRNEAGKLDFLSVCAGRPMIEDRSFTTSFRSPLFPYNYLEIIVIPKK